MNRATGVKLSAPADPVRRGELAAIHVARAKLALTESSYRDLVRRFTKNRTDSSAQMTGKERQDLIGYFRQIGFAKDKAKTPAARRVDFRPLAMKVKAMWFALHQLGVVRDPSEEACAAFICRHTKIAVMRWNQADHLSKAIDCLRGWCGRYQYEPRPYKSAFGDAPQEGSFQPGLIFVQFRRMEELGALPRTANARQRWLAENFLSIAPAATLGHDEAEAIIHALGNAIRKVAKSHGDGDDAA
jgi:phage gp16-like protein